MIRQSQQHSLPCQISYLCALAYRVAQRIPKYISFLGFWARGGQLLWPSAGIIAWVRSLGVTASLVDHSWSRTVQYISLRIPFFTVLLGLARGLTDNTEATFVLKT